jgi:DNA repair exonuclease SbcCD nuclease subunit
VYLLPGNHDPLDAGSVYRSSTFLDHKPANVTVLEDGAVHQVRLGVEVAGAPWFTKRPLSDLVAQALATLEPDPATRRILVAHGAVDDLMDFGNPAQIRLAAVEQAFADHRIDYLALGDRHSTTQIGTSGRVWYAGAPEPTDYDEKEQDNVLLVEVGPESCVVTKLALGLWRFALGTFELAGQDPLDELRRWLAAFDNQDRVILKLVLRGTISLSDSAALESLLERSRSLYAAIEEWQRHRDVVVRPDDDDFADLALAGFAEAAVKRLRATAEGGGPDAYAARDALGLLVRLVGKAGVR